mgnify:FL=1
MSPITVPLPCWTNHGTGWTAAIGDSLRLVVMPVREERRWSWEVLTQSAGHIIVSHRSSWVTHHERTAEAAQIAAWDALAKWLGATA